MILTIPLQSRPQAAADHAHGATACRHAFVTIFWSPNSVKWLTFVPSYRVGNKPLTITFAEPRRADIAADQQNEIKSIFVGNLPDTANEAKLREIFGPLGEITRAFIPAPRDGKTRREFGFVHYVDRASVLQAIKQNDEGDKFVMDSTPLDVSACY